MLQIPFEIDKNVVRSFGNREVAAMQADSSNEKEMVEMGIPSMGFGTQDSLLMKNM